MWPWKKVARKDEDHAMEMLARMANVSPDKMRDILTIGGYAEINPPHMKHFYETLELSYGAPAVKEFARLIRSGELSIKYPGQPLEKVLERLTMEIPDPEFEALWKQPKDLK